MTKILIVEDNATNRQILEHRAQQWGMYVACAADSREALRLFLQGGPFDAAIVDLQLPDLAGVPRDELPRMLVRLFLDRWEGDPADDALLVLLRSAVTNEYAAERMRQVFAEQVAPALATALGHDLAPRRAGLLAAQLLGLALTRYLLRLPSVTALSREEVEHALTPAIRATLELA